MADIEKRKVLDETNLKDFVKTLIAVMEEKGVGGGTGGGGTGAMPIVTITSETSVSPSLVRRVTEVKTYPLRVSVLT